MTARPIRSLPLGSASSAAAAQHAGGCFPAPVARSSGPKPLFDRDARRGEIEARQALALAEARAVAEQEIARAGEERLAAVIARHLDGVRRIDELIHGARPGASEMVALAMVIARELLGRELAIDCQPLVAAVGEGLRQASGRGPVVVRLSPDDLGPAQEGLPAELASGIRFVSDPTLARGGWILETPNYVVDASMESRLEAVRAAVASVIATHPALRAGAQARSGAVPGPGAAEEPAC